MCGPVPYVFCVVLGAAVHGVQMPWDAGQVNLQEAGLSNSAAQRAIHTGRAHASFIAPCNAGVRVVSIAAGHTHSLAICAEGCVYSWGSGPGIGTASASSRSTHTSMECVSWLPRRLHAASLEGLRMTRVFAGMGTSGAVDLAGRAYAWGANAACQLGLPTTAPHVETPTRVRGCMAGCRSFCLCCMLLLYGSRCK